MTKKSENPKQYPDCAPEQCFWAQDGQILKNIAELPAALRKMNTKNFQYHVNAEKNDFASWIADVFGEHRLAETIRAASSKAGMISAVNRAL